MVNIHIILSLCGLFSTGCIVSAMETCSCGTNGWDCAGKGRTIIFDTETCTSATTWRFQKNNLQTIPFRSTSVREIDFSFNDLGRGTPTRVRFSTLRILDLSHNYLKDLTLLSGTKVEKLIVYDNLISDINVHSVMTVTAELIFSGNYITSIPAYSFSQQVSSLDLIDLSRNPIAEVSEEAFYGVSLKKLFLNSTQLSSLPSGIFKGQTTLTYLSLKDNKLSNLSEDLFSSLTILETLELQGNQLSEIQESTFKNLVNLKKLYLDHNRLTTLPESLFSRLHSLRELVVRDNLLSSIPSLRECSAPIELALFSENKIVNLGEKEIRSLLRGGFVYADLSKNPISEESLQWALEANDLQVALFNSSSAAADYGTIQLTTADHGYVYWSTS